MKNKKSILKYQFSGVMQDATTVKKPDRQIVVKNNNDNWKQLVAKNQPKQQTHLFELTPEIKKDIEEHTKKGDVQLTNGEWITKEEYNKLKAKKSTGAINPDYSDPITMGITMAAAPGQGLLKAATSKVVPKLNTVGKVIREGVDMIDPTSIGLGLSKAKLNSVEKIGDIDELRLLARKDPYLLQKIHPDDAKLLKEKGLGDKRYDKNDTESFLFKIENAQAKDRKTKKENTNPVFNQYDLKDYTKKENTIPQYNVNSVDIKKINEDSSFFS
jgi:hypothetical protein